MPSGPAAGRSFGGSDMRPGLPFSVFSLIVVGLGWARVINLYMPRSALDWGKTYHPIIIGLGA